jgi:hypothetical protein
MSNKYKIVDDFQAGSTGIRVLVLDREYEFMPPASEGTAVIDDRRYKFNLNSIRNWVTIESNEKFAGKTVEFY